MPNAVDISKIPEYRDYAPASLAFIRARCIDYNNAFNNTVNQLRASYTNLTIYVPDMFGLLESILASPSSYGVVNAQYAGKTIDALSNPDLSDKSLNGPGAVYIWWDSIDPTAKVHAWMADMTQQLISPARFNSIAWVNNSNRLDLVNVPIGRNGFVDSCTNLATIPINWLQRTNFSSVSLTQSVFVPVSGPVQFYRLRYPFSWTWP
jgi:hypothetical protein